MILHIGERVYWGAPEVIYLEGTITQLDETRQSVVVHIERASPNSAHLIGTDAAFFADGLALLKGNSPPGVISQRSEQRQPAPQLNDEEKVLSAASVAIHQQYGYELPPEQERTLIDQVVRVINADPAMRSRVIASMNQILSREI